MKVRYTPRAKADLQAIFAYIYDHSPSGALKVRTAIRQAAVRIGHDPGRGQATDKACVRRVPVVRYRYAIYFRVRDEEVHIVHIRHTSRQLPTAIEL